MERIRHINPSRTEFSYLANTGQVSSILHLRSDDSEILNLAYAYDGRGNITQKSINTIPTDYGYDMKDQLEDVDVEEKDEGQVFSCKLRTYE